MSDIKKFEKVFKDNYKKFYPNTQWEKFQIDLSIFTTSLFNDSLINKIILSMTAIEVLSEQTERSAEEIKAIDNLIKKQMK